MHCRQEGQGRRGQACPPTCQSLPLPTLCASLSHTVSSSFSFTRLPLSLASLTLTSASIVSLPVNKLCLPLSPHLLSSAFSPLLVHSPLDDFAALPVPSLFTCVSVLLSLSLGI